MHQVANKQGFGSMVKHAMLMVALTAAIAAPTSAQITTVDPNVAIDADLGTPPAPAPSEENVTVQDGIPTEGALPAQAGSPSTNVAPSDQNTFQEDDLIGAAEGVFGKGAKGLGKLIEDILKKQGRPNGYIVGREGGGAFVVGLRYGSGTLNHKVEGQMPVYWTGPSIGFDAGANAGSTFVLVYNLYDTEDIYRRYPSGEGVAYLVGGFNASYLRRGNVVLIPIRVGAGLRLGANVGYMKFSKKQRWLPF
ncbi:DUF1134 domain-containing protein [Sphingorhabdus sp. IMCC26285]|jgi:hypothetical protein|uniref:DUF1134 domain-containing protein n=1 Tax=Sphingorhabdus profundilacus TaxID=2509718 RepID=A0A6I4M225_9SPHN|nr:DUF1134 domain-containing protein [Sphingorhabdus profundilacus]